MQLRISWIASALAALWGKAEVLVGKLAGLHFKAGGFPKATADKTIKLSGGGTELDSFGQIGGSPASGLERIPEGIGPGDDDLPFWPTPLPCPRTVTHWCHTERGRRRLTTGLVGLGASHSSCAPVAGLKPAAATGALTFAVVAAGCTFTMPCFARISWNQSFHRTLGWFTTAAVSVSARRSVSNRSAK